MILLFSPYAWQHPLQFFKANMHSLGNSENIRKKKYTIMKIILTDLTFQVGNLKSNLTP